MKKIDKQYCWSYDGENYNNLELGELIDNLRSEWTDDEIVGMKISRAEAIKADPEDMFHIDYFLEGLGETVWDDFGEYAEDWPDCSPEAKKRLEKYIKNWLNKECPCNFWHVKNVEEYVITIDDLN